MPSYSDQDSDEGRLPEGFTRTGYDADSETYTYTDQNGSSYSGLPGNRYGRLYPTGSAAHEDALQKGDPWERQYAKQSWWQREDGRWLACFLLIAGGVLFTLIWWIGPFEQRTHYACATGETTHVVSRGDLCWKIAETYKVDVADLRGPIADGSSYRLDLVCERLDIGGLICIPEKK